MERLILAVIGVILLVSPVSYSCSVALAYLKMPRLCSQRDSTMGAEFFRRTVPILLNYKWRWTTGTV